MTLFGWKPPWRRWRRNLRGLLMFGVSDAGARLPHVEARTQRGHMVNAAWVAALLAPLCGPWGACAGSVVLWAIWEARQVITGGQKLWALLRDSGWDLLANMAGAAGAAVLIGAEWADPVALAVVLTLWTVWAGLMGVVRGDAP